MTRHDETINHTFAATAAGFTIIGACALVQAAAVAGILALGKPALAAACGLAVQIAAAVTMAIMLDHAACRRELRQALNARCGAALSLNAWGTVLIDRDERGVSLDRDDVDRAMESSERYRRAHARVMKVLPHV